MASSTAGSTPGLHKRDETLRVAFQWSRLATALSALGRLQQTPVGGQVVKPNKLTADRRLLSRSTIFGQVPCLAEIRRNTPYSEPVAYAN
jgi:hypothetical protein